VLPRWQTQNGRSPKLKPRPISGVNAFDVKPA
jgi:hypothetical protein